MIISFFEEFPNERSLSKTELIKWPCKLYIAAESIEKFNRYISMVQKNRYIKGFVYWPILKKKEGYWISPFSKRKALKRIIDDIKENGKGIEIMLDLELPFSRNKLLLLTQLPNFFFNKRSIKELTETEDKKYLCEYLWKERALESLQKWLGIFFDPVPYNSKKIKMMYHSMHKCKPENARETINQLKERYGKKIIIGFGTIATGVLGDEPILSYEQLSEDLMNAKEEGIEEAIIFRLEGLDKNYAKIIKNYS